MLFSRIKNLSIVGKSGSAFLVRDRKRRKTYEVLVSGQKVSCTCVSFAMKGFCSHILLVYKKIGFSEKAFRSMALKWVKSKVKFNREFRKHIKLLAALSKKKSLISLSELRNQNIARELVELGILKKKGEKYLIDKSFLKSMEEKKLINFLK